MRVARLALAVLLVLLVAPASAAPKELVLYADGPAYASITLPVGTELLLSSARFATEGQYAALTVTAGRNVIGVAAKLPGFYSHRPYVPRWPTQRVGGRITVRLVTSGPTKVRIPTDGLARAVRLTQRLQGAAVFRQDARAAPPPVVRDDLPVSVLAGSLVIHGIDLSRATYAHTVRTMCVDRSDGPCTRLTVNEPNKDVQVFYPGDGPSGALTAKVVLALAGAALEPMPHYVVAVPG